MTESDVSRPAEFPPPPNGLPGLTATEAASRLRDQGPNLLGRTLAAYGGVFVAGSLAWGVAFDGFRPDRYDLLSAAICLMGVAVIMYAPRAAQS